MTTGTNGLQTKRNTMTLTLGPSLKVRCILFLTLCIRLRVSNSPALLPMVVLIKRRLIPFPERTLRRRWKEFGAALAELTFVLIYLNRAQGKCRRSRCLTTPCYLLTLATEFFRKVICVWCLPLNPWNEPRKSLCIPQRTHPLHLGRR